MSEITVKTFHAAVDRSPTFDLRGMPITHRKDFTLLKAVLYIENKLENKKKAKIIWLYANTIVRDKTLSVELINEDDLNTTKENLENFIIGKSDIESTSKDVRVYFEKIQKLTGDVVQKFENEEAIFYNSNSLHDEVFLIENPIQALEENSQIYCMRYRNDNNIYQCAYNQLIRLLQCKKHNILPNDVDFKVYFFKHTTKTESRPESFCNIHVRIPKKYKPFEKIVSNFNTMLLQIDEQKKQTLKESFYCLLLEKILLKLQQLHNYGIALRQVTEQAFFFHEDTYECLVINFEKSYSEHDLAFLKFYNITGKSRETLFESSELYIPYANVVYKHIKLTKISLNALNSTTTAIPVDTKVIYNKQNVSMMPFLYNYGKGFSKKQTETNLEITHNPDSLYTFSNFVISDLWQLGMMFLFLLTNLMNSPNDATFNKNLQIVFIDKINSNIFKKNDGIEKVLNRKNINDKLTEKGYGPKSSLYHMINLLLCETNLEQRLNLDSKQEHQYLNGINLDLKFIALLSFLRKKIEPKESLESDVFQLNFFNPKFQFVFNENKFALEKMKDADFKLLQQKGELLLNTKFDFPKLFNKLEKRIKETKIYYNTTNDQSIIKTNLINLTSKTNVVTRNIRKLLSNVRLPSYDSKIDDFYDKELYKLKDIILATGFIFFTLDNSIFKHLKSDIVVIKFTDAPLSQLSNTDSKVVNYVEQNNTECWLHNLDYDETKLKTELSKIPDYVKLQKKYPNFDMPLLLKMYVDKLKQILHNEIGSAQNFNFSFFGLRQNKHVERNGFVGAGPIMSIVKSLSMMVIFDNLKQDIKVKYYNTKFNEEIEYKFDVNLSVKYLFQWTESIMDEPDQFEKIFNLLGNNTTLAQLLSHTTPFSLKQEHEDEFIELLIDFSIHEKNDGLTSDNQIKGFIAFYEKALSEKVDKKNNDFVYSSALFQLGTILFEKFMQHHSNNKTTIKECFCNMVENSGKHPELLKILLRNWKVIGSKDYKNFTVTAGGVLLSGWQLFDLTEVITDDERMSKILEEIHNSAHIEDNPMCVSIPNSDDVSYCYGWFVRKSRTRPMHSDISPASKKKFMAARGYQGQFILIEVSSKNMYVYHLVGDKPELGYINPEIKIDNSEKFIKECILLDDFYDIVELVLKDEDENDDDFE